MRDIVLYILAVALVTGSTVVALSAGPDVERAGELLHEQAGRERATAGQLKDWTARLER